MTINIDHSTLPEAQRLALEKKLNEGWRVDEVFRKGEILITWQGFFAEINTDGNCVAIE